MDKIIAQLQNYQANLLPETPVSAAVVVPLIISQNNIKKILLLQRPYVFSSYAGDICFPGGLKELSDQDLRATALRETQEETGLRLQASQIIAQLDDFQDRHGNLVRAYVAIIPENDLTQLKPSTEVEKIYYLPLDQLLEFNIDEKNFRPSLRKPHYLYQNHELLIWGLTAAILVHLGNIVYHLDKPVGHTP